MSLKETNQPMEFDAANWPTIVQDFGTTVNGWLVTVDPGALSLAFVALVVVVLLRRKISDWIVGGTGTGLKIAEHILGLGNQVSVPRRKPTPDPTVSKGSKEPFKRGLKRGETRRCEGRRLPELATAPSKTVCCSFLCHSLQKCMSRHNSYTGPYNSGPHLRNFLVKCGVT